MLFNRGTLRDQVTVAPWLDILLLGSRGRKKLKGQCMEQEKLVTSKLLEPYHELSRPKRHRIQEQTTARDSHYHANQMQAMAATWMPPIAAQLPLLRIGGCDTFLLLQDDEVHTILSSASNREESNCPEKSGPLFRTCFPHHASFPGE